jgi:hypothetical protein
MRHDHMHRLDNLEDPLRADGAVHADHRRSGRSQGRYDLFRLVAQSSTAVFREAHLGDDRQVTHSARRLNRNQDLPQVAKGFKHQQVGPLLQKRADLLCENLARHVGGKVAIRFEDRAEGSDGTGN